MLIFECPTCRTSLSAEPTQAGQLVRCPQCANALRVPAPRTAVAPAITIDKSASVSAPAAKSFSASSLPSGAVGTLPRREISAALSSRRYAFSCPFCSSRLEATGANGGQEGTCPTCDSAITIPILDRYNRLIDPKTQKIVKPDPHPVHAYAAAGKRAPQIVRRADGTQVIKCARCPGVSPITSNNCKSCGMPFTMEGTTADVPGSSNGFAIASLVLGIIALPGGCTLIIPALSIIFGVIALRQISAKAESGGRGLAIAGIICASIGLALGLWADFR